MRLLHEDEHTFQVEGPNGAYRIAKAGLSPAMMERIRGYAQGGEVEEPQPEPWEFGRTPFGHVARVAGQAARTYFPKIAPELGREVARNFPGIGSAVQAGQFMFGSQWGAPSEATETTSATPEVLPPEGAQSLPPAQTENPENTELVQDGTQEALQPWASELVAGGESPAPPALPSSSVSSIPRAQPPGADLEGEPEWLRESLAATDELARAHQQAGQPIEETDEIRAARENERRQEETYQAAQQEADEAFKALANHPDIDPNRYWHDQSVGQKLGVTLGLLLSGIGAGILRKPNGAARVVQSAIDRDVAAQRADLGKAQTFYSMALERLRSTRAALLDARANTREVVAAVAERKARADESAIGVARVRMLGAEQRRIAAQERREAVRIAYEDAQRREQMDLQRHQVGLQERQIGLQEQAQKQAAARQRELDQIRAELVVGGNIDPQAVEALPEKERERVVQLPDGTRAFARSKKDAEELASAYSAYSQFKATIAEIKAYMARPGPREVTPWTDKAKEASALKTKAIGHLKDVLKLGALDAGVERFAEGLVPDPSAINQSGVQQQLKVLESMVENLLDSELNARLMRSQVMRGQIPEAY